jgi:curved DNA-binding protein CbpA
MKWCQDSRLESLWSDALMDQSIDYYEVLQISVNADAELIQRVFRLLARRYHPDNLSSGNATVFRQLHEAYSVLSDVEKRAQYDAIHEARRHQHCRLASGAANAENDFESEQALRMTLLEVFYTRRRLDPRAPNLFPSDLEGLTGTPREHLEFTTWFLVQKSLLIRTDNSSLSITAAGVEYLEQHYLENSRRRRRLSESAGPEGAAHAAA